MNTINLIYLAILTGRIPIIPPFLPSHFGTLETAAPIPFRDIFDVSRLASELSIPIVEWDEVKVPKSPEIESIGCWSTQAGVKTTETRPAYSSHPSILNLDVSFTPVPSTFTLSRGAIENDYILSTWALASLAYPESRQRQLDWQRHRILPDGSGKKVEPDDQLLCYDLLYYIGLVESAPAGDFFADYSPFWNLVGTRMHWTKPLTDLATQYLRRQFGVPESSPVPPFISVHIRRSDFKAACFTEKDPDKCFAPVKAYERRVNEIKQSLRSRPNGIDVTKLIVTSDEKDPKWWDQIAALGPEWGWIDHKAERTAEKHGQWYPLILDAVIQSLGTGFVGTQHSTMSGIAHKRVHDWQGGLGVEVQWGSLGADDH
ncbi:O-FucT domain protein [Ceratobasidium sp. AG-Ba]|nr:O-FucT domain protein [Ceratobasidium sp. AG-Ba]QRW15073.1 O-FucT domain protein [Ceratobasidium sp. AG-Ba]